MESKHQNDDDTSAGIFLTIPVSIRLVLGLTGATVFVTCFVLFIGFLFNRYPSPNELQLSSFFTISLLLMFIALFGNRVKVRNIGPVEFQTALNTQADERDRSLAFLNKRIGELEEHVSKDVASNTFLYQIDSSGYRSSIIKFLQSHPGKGFSPFKLKQIGGDFLASSEADINLIRATLQRLLSESVVTTTISKKGNTLYRIAKSD